MNMNIFSVIVLGIAIVTLSFFCSLIFFVLYIGPKKITKALNNLKEIKELINLIKYQSFVNLRSVGQITKQFQDLKENLEIVKIYINNLAIMVQTEDEMGQNEGETGQNEGEITIKSFENDFEKSSYSFTEE